MLDLGCRGVEEDVCGIKKDFKEEEKGSIYSVPRGTNDTKVFMLWIMIHSSRCSE